MTEPEWDFDFSKRKPVKCRNCGKERGNHQAGSFHCPEGAKHRTFGYSRFGKTVWEEPAALAAKP